MKVQAVNLPIATSFVVGLLIAAEVCQAQAPKVKMTTETPPGIATPDRLETRLGTLTLRDGVPDKETAQKVTKYGDRETPSW